VTTTDGQGLLMRHATMADAETLLAWRNDPHTRRMSLQTDEVALERHLGWLERALTSSARVILVAEQAATGAAVGMCRFDIDELCPERAEVSVNLAPDQRGRGMGSALLGDGIAAFAAMHPEVRTLTAVIRPENAASVRLFESAGFLRAGAEETLLHYERSSPGLEQLP
jgi:L-amino acid N-acyltransferase YncA